MNGFTFLKGPSSGWVESKLERSEAGEQIKGMLQCFSMIWGRLIGRASGVRKKLDGLNIRGEERS